MSKVANIPGITIEENNLPNLVPHVSDVNSYENNFMNGQINVSKIDS